MYLVISYQQKEDKWNIGRYSVWFLDVLKSSVDKGKGPEHSARIATWWSIGNTFSWWSRGCGFDYRQWPQDKLFAHKSLSPDGRTWDTGVSSQLNGKSCSALAVQDLGILLLLAMERKFASHSSIDIYVMYNSYIILFFHSNECLPSPATRHGSRGLYFT